MKEVVGSGELLFGFGIVWARASLREFSEKERRRLFPGRRRRKFIYNIKWVGVRKSSVLRPDFLQGSLLFLLEKVSLVSGLPLSPYFFPRVWYKPIRVIYRRQSPWFSIEGFPQARHSSILSIPAAPRPHRITIPIRNFLLHMSLRDPTFKPNFLNLKGERERESSKS